MDCGSGERCVGSIPTCKIDISNRIGLTNYTINLLGDYKNAFGVQQTISTNMTLPIDFKQEGVLLRFEKIYNVTLSQFTDSWIAYDINGDGTLDGLGGGSGVSIGGVSCVTSGNSNFISYYGNYIVQKGVNKIVLCEEKGISDNSIDFQASDSDSGRAIKSLNPLQPYTSQNCPGNPLNTICQEVYTLLVSQPAPVCGNGNIEGTEVCDGGSLGGQTCTTRLGGSYSGTLMCSSDCLSFDTSQCTLSSSSFIKFRTSDLGYGTTSAIAFNQSSACGVGALTRYGYSTASGNLAGVCSTKMLNIPAGVCSGVNTLVMTNLKGGWKTGGEEPSLWKNPTSGTYCVCDDDGVNINIKKYTDSSSQLVNVDSSEIQIDLTKELVC